MIQPGYDANGDPLVQGVVAATAVLTAVGTLGDKTGLAQKIEAAMTQAVVDMNLLGETDPVLIKDAMMAARQSVLEGKA